ncbi:MAG: hypothetical protein Fur003_0060 [Candidatus Dojkabacteria bacterium]
MKEVEILVKVESDLQPVLAKMALFEKKGVKEVLDIYYYDPLRSELQPKDFALERCFRLRQKGDKSYMTYKIDHFEGDVWSYSDEFEIEISSVSQAEKIVKELGLEELIRIDNTKYLFNDDLYEIAIEDVKGLGIFVEVERLEVKDEEEIELVNEEIRNFIKKFDISCKEMNMGKPELMLRLSKKS